MAEWAVFLAAQVGASAALAGLVFVGVSINLAKILAQPHLANRALEALAVLLAVLILSSLLLVPGEPLTLLGIEVMVGGLIIWLIISGLQLDHWRTLPRQYRINFAFNTAIGQLATLPFIVGGAVLFAGSSDGMYWLVPAVIFSFLHAFMDAWVLLIEINR